MDVGPRGLTLAGEPLAALAERHGTPAYLYDGVRIAARVAELRSALAGLDARIDYAVKANRFPPVLRLLRALGVGADVVSPREVALVRAEGFREVSFTASCLSDCDLDALAADGVHVNLDHLGTLRRYGARVPRGTAVGLRVDPAVAVGYGVNPKTTYGGSKLGLALDALPEAVRTAEAAGLVVDTMHLHLGWGLRAGDETRVDEAFRRLAAAAEEVPTVRYVSVGGGLGARLREGDAPLPVARWAELVRRHLARWVVRCEPGTFVVADAGVLLTTVVATWEKHGVAWVGLDAGHGVNVYAAHYDLPLTLLRVRDPLAAPDRRVHVAGNINEAGDVFARDVVLPALDEGDRVVLWPAGAYGSAMASDHCLRGEFAEVLLDGAAHDGATG